VHAQESSSAETTRALLLEADRYLDAAPRSDSVDEQVGVFTVFHGTSVWSYYARPRRGLERPIAADDLARLDARYVELDRPLAIEWIDELTPSLEPVARAAGLVIERHALLELDPAGFEPAPPPPGWNFELLGSADARLVSARAVCDVAFGVGGVERGPAGGPERDARAALIGEAMRNQLRRRAANGLTLTVAASSLADGVVAAGALQPSDRAAEIVAVATLPGYRRRGLAAAITGALVVEAAVLGLDRVFLQAQSEDVARIYERVGFRRIGTHLAASWPRRRQDVVRSA
jgi:ribosomal protein S18 acetylase RimI-like enzyme